MEPPSAHFFLPALLPRPHLPLETVEKERPNNDFLRFCNHARVGTSTPFPCCAAHNAALYALTGQWE